MDILIILPISSIASMSENRSSFSSALLASCGDGFKRSTVTFRRIIEIKKLLTRNFVAS
jgi:hypothetical protein